MADDVFKKFKGLEGIDTSKAMSSIKVVDPFKDINERVLQTNQELIRSADEIYRKRELDRQELLEATRNSRASSVNIGYIGDNANGLMFGNVNSTQTVVVNQEFNYEKVSEVLE